MEFVLEHKKEGRFRIHIDGMQLTVDPKSLLHRTFTPRVRRCLF